MYDDGVQAGVPPTAPPPIITPVSTDDLAAVTEEVKKPPVQVTKEQTPEEIATIEKEVIRKAVNGEQLSASEAQIASRFDISAIIDEQKAQEEVVEGEEGEKVTVTTGSTLPNLDEFITEYQELVVRDPNEGENYLSKLLDSQEISDADADAIRNSVEVPIRKI